MFSILRRVFSNKVLWFFILVLVGGYFRIVAIQETRIDRPIRADAQDYYLSAYNLARNGIYSRSLGNLVNPPREVIPDSYRPPGLPLIIALFMDLWPRHDQIMWRVQLVNVALGVVVVLAIFLCAALVLPFPAAVAVGLLTAGSPHLISMTVYILTETPAAFFIALLLALTAIRIPENHRAKSLFFFALGITVGCLSLFRPVYVAFAPAVALIFPGRQNKVQAAILGCMGAALIVAPWFIRNFLDVPAGSSPSVVTAAILEGAYRGYVFNGIPSTFPYGARHDPLFPLLEKDFIGTLEFVSNKIALDPLGMMKWYLSRSRSTCCSGAISTASAMFLSIPSSLVHFATMPCSEQSTSYFITLTRLCSGWRFSDAFCLGLQLRVGCGQNCKSCCAWPVHY